MKPFVHMYVCFCICECVYIFDFLEPCLSLIFETGDSVVGRPVSVVDRSVFGSFCGW